MFFQWNIDSPHVSDYFQHFLKNDLFDLYDLFFSIQGQSSHLGNVGNALLGQTLYLKQRKTIFMDKYKLQTYFSEIFIFFQNLKASPYHTKCVLNLHPTKVFTNVVYQTGPFWSEESKIAVKSSFFKITLLLFFHFAV